MTMNDIQSFEDGRIKIVFDQNNPFVKMAVEIFHQFLIDEAAGFINAASTLHINARLLQRTFAEERESMVVLNKEKIPRFGTPAYEKFDISFNTAQNIHIVNQETK